MDSFVVYYEKFSLNPKNWFLTPEEKNAIRVNDEKLKQQARQKAMVYIPKLKQLLKQKGYVIKKDENSYTVRKGRVLALSPRDSSREKNFSKDPILSIPYIKALFTLAHEVGHVLQWDDDTDTKFKFQEFYQNLKDAEQKNPYEVVTLKTLHDLYYELDAWVRGMEFIPYEYKKQYKQYAYRAYKTYMDRHPKYYNSEMLLKNLLYKLNFEEQ